MRRAALLLALGALGVAVTVGAAGGDGDRYRVAAVFGNTSGLIPGQNVQIAGAVVGAVDGIELTPNHRARVTMKIQRGFAPFRSDAECEIKPQSLIGEKFVQCDPGTPDAPELRGDVPLAHTHSPVDLDLIFAALREPYSQRLALVISELGTGLAGRPHDLQQAIRRAAPGLQQADRVLAIVNRDRSQLGRLIARTDGVLAELAGRDRDVERFVDRADAATTAVADRRDALGRGIDRLPPLLAELEPSAKSLESVSLDARPVVRELKRATPSLRALFADLAPLTDSGRPALRALRNASDEGQKAVTAARPVATRLEPAAKLLPHVGEVAQDLTHSLRATRGVEWINEFLWHATAATARFDQVSHIVPSYQVTGACQQYATKPVKGCSAHYASYPDQGSVLPTATKQEKARKHHRRRKTETNPNGALTPAGPAPNSQLPAPVIPALPELPPLPNLQPQQEKLLDFLLR